MFPDEDELDGVEWDEYGAAVDPAAFQEAPSGVLASTLEGGPQDTVPVIASLTTSGAHCVIHSIRSCLPSAPKFHRG